MTVDTPTLLSPSISRRRFEFARLVRAVGYVAVVPALAVAVGDLLHPDGPDADRADRGRRPRRPASSTAASSFFLILVVGWEIAALVLARRRGRAAARLHIRIVALFSIVAATPAILVAVVASVTLDRGLDNWFSTSTRAIVENSADIARPSSTRRRSRSMRRSRGVEGRARAGPRAARRRSRPLPGLPRRGRRAAAAFPASSWSRATARSSPRRSRARRPISRRRRPRRSSRRSSSPAGRR